MARTQPSQPLSVPWSLPRSGRSGNPLAMSHLVGQGISEGSPALLGLYLYSSSGSGDTTNRKDFKNVVFAACSTFPFHLIRSEQSRQSREQPMQRRGCSQNKPCRRWKQLPWLPGRWAERCTWACHTQTGLWWCTGKLRRWCCQLGWTLAASDPLPAWPSEPLSRRPHWMPEDTQERKQHSTPSHINVLQVLGRNNIAECRVDKS